MGTDETPKGTSEHDMKRLQLRIPMSHYKELKMLAEYDGRTVTDLIRQVLGSFLRDTGQSTETESGEKK
jgi:hypothetical protein